MSSGPRIPPGTVAQIGRINAAIAWVIGRSMGSATPPGIFTTLSRHRGLFRPWLRFAGALMPGGRLPRIDSELVILRVAHNCGSEYERRHHERIGQTAGLSAEEVQLVRLGPFAPGWNPRQAMLLRACDELHSDARAISDELWAELAGEFSDVELIELCMLIGHYEMLAMTLNSLRVEPDTFTREQPPRLVVEAQRLLERVRR